MVDLQAVRGLANRDPTDSPSYVLLDVAQRVRRAVGEALAGTGLTGPQLNVLGAVVVLTDRGRPPSQRDVATLTGVDEVTTGQVVRLLLQRGMLERVETADRRVKALTATESGLATCLAAVAAIDRMDHALFGPEETARLIAALLPHSSLTRSESGRPDTGVVGATRAEASRRVVQPSASRQE